AGRSTAENDGGTETRAGNPLAPTAGTSTARDGGRSRPLCLMKRSMAGDTEDGGKAGDSGPSVAGEVGDWARHTPAQEPSRATTMRIARSSRHAARLAAEQSAFAADIRVTIPRI